MMKDKQTNTMVIINKMNTKKIIRGKSLEGTPFFISQDEKLGKGTYGEVYKCYNRQQPSQLLVVKIISLLESDNQESIKTELEMIHELPHHQNLVNCLKAHIASEKNLYIIMEYCNQGSLQNYISKMTLMPQHQIWDILRQICKGYQVLYDANLLHRDIKPENILIHNKVFKLADFGLSKKIKNHALNQNLSYAGSPLYIAPEIIDKNEGSSKVDIFSLGSVLYELAYDGEPPFFKKDDHYNSPADYYKNRKMKKLVVPPRNKKGQQRSEQLRQLITQMLEFNENDRISWEEVFEHPKININQIESSPVPKLQHVISQEQSELQKLRMSLQVVSKSSATMEPIVQKDNPRQQSQHLTIELINFEQFLQHSQLRSLEHEMFRLKITQLTILHCSNKISYIIRDNKKNKALHNHILNQLQKIVIEGYLYLLKINQLLTRKITNYEPSIMEGLNKILTIDKEQLLQAFRKQTIVLNDLDFQKQISQLQKYDVRRYEQELYSILTQYCDYPTEAKEKVVVIISLLMDIYDSSLKLTDMINTERVVWQKYQDINEIQTKMDEFCYNKLEPHKFHSYLLDKEHTNVKDNHETMKKLGLLFA